MFKFDIGQKVRMNKIELLSTVNGEEGSLDCYYIDEDVLIWLAKCGHVFTIMDRVLNKDEYDRPVNCYQIVYDHDIVGWGEDTIWLYEPWILPVFNSDNEEFE